MYSSLDLIFRTKSIAIKNFILENTWFFLKLKVFIVIQWFRIHDVEGMYSLCYPLPSYVGHTANILSLFFFFFPFVADLEMQEQIEKSLSVGRTSFEVSLSVWFITALVCILRRKITKWNLLFYFAFLCCCCLFFLLYVQAVRHH